MRYVHIKEKFYRAVNDAILTPFLTNELFHTPRTHIHKCIFFQHFRETHLRMNEVLAFHSIYS